MLELGRTSACIATALLCVGAGFLIHSAIGNHESTKLTDDLLVLVGAATLIVIAWQAFETRRSVEAARISADAALRTASQAVASERAWVDAVITPEPSRLNKRFVELKLRNTGKTPADVVGYWWYWGYPTPGRAFRPDALGNAQYWGIGRLLGVGEEQERPDFERIALHSMFAEVGRDGMFCIRIEYRDLIQVGDARKHHTLLVWNYIHVTREVNRISSLSEFE